MPRPVLNIGLRSVLIVPSVWPYALSADPIHFLTSWCANCLLDPGLLVRSSRFLIITYMVDFGKPVRLYLGWIFQKVKTKKRRFTDPMTFRPLNKMRYPEKIAKTIQMGILNGKFKYGERLPAEACETPVRR